MQILVSFVSVFLRTRCSVTVAGAIEMAAYCIGTLMLCLFFLVNGIPRPNEGTGKARVHEQQPLSHEEHYNGDQHEHNADFDHEAFLGNEQKATFDQLSPEESLRRLGYVDIVNSKAIT